MSRNSPRLSGCGRTGVSKCLTFFDQCPERSLRQSRHMQLAIQEIGPPEMCRSNICYRYIVLVHCGYRLISEHNNTASSLSWRLQAKKQLLTVLLARSREAAPSIARVVQAQPDIGAVPPGDSNAKSTFHLGGGIDSFTSPCWL